MKFVDYPVDRKAFWKGRGGGVNHDLGPCFRSRITLCHRNSDIRVVWHKAEINVNKNQVLILWNECREYVIKFCYPSHVYFSNFERYKQSCWTWIRKRFSTKVGIKVTCRSQSYMKPWNLKYVNHSTGFIKFTCNWSGERIFYISNERKIKI